MFASDRELYGSIIYALIVLLTLWGTLFFARADAKRNIGVSMPKLAALVVSCFALAYGATWLIDILTPEDVCIYVILGFWTVAVIATALVVLRQNQPLRRFAVAAALAVATVEVLSIPSILLGSH
jgi:hypothetical protein